MRLRPGVRLSVVVLSCLLIGAAAATADSVVLDASKDNTLYEDATGSLSDGAGAYLFSGNTNQSPPMKRRGLIAFNVAGSIPAGSTIASVTLNLRVSRTKAGSETVQLRRALADWGEGTSNADSQEGQGALATTGDATWRHRFYNTTLWATLGGDFSPTASASATVGGNGVYAWTSAGMVADVQMWLDSPSSNFGWVILNRETVAQTAKRFDSRENGTAGNRPKLTVTFNAPVVTGACCSGGDCLVRTQTECASAGGLFQGAGTTCSPNPCLQPSGACCAASGVCTTLSSTNCSAAGGVYRGDGSTCSPNPCPQPTGGCCAPSGLCSVVTLDQCGALGGSYLGDGADCSAAHCPVILTPFVDPLPLPGVAQPVSGVVGGVATYDMRMTEQLQKLHRDLPPTTVWGFNGGYPGPTLEVTTGLPVTANWINDLRDGTGALRTEHYLPVDTCMHGPDMEGSTPRTVVHMHGGHVPMEADGYPEATFLPGERTTYVYPNDQLPATLWYHDHALGITRLNVYMGLAGFYLVRDAFETSLGLPAGEYEVPLVIQDRTFRADGSLVYPAVWQDHFFGDTILVNGKVWPYLDVKQGKYRFRVIGGSNSRTFTLHLSRPEMVFRVIGNDGGLLPAPVTVTELTIGPGERYDFVIDFAGLAAGTEIIMTNSAPIMFPGTPGDGVIPNVMKFVVQNQAGHTAPLPVALRPVPRIPESEALVHRSFELRKGSEPCAGSMWTINGLGWDDITEYPQLGTAEVWGFDNFSGVSHPMHMHLVMFQTLDSQPFEVVGGVAVPSGPAVPPPPHAAGWKDTVMVGPNERVRVIARFTGFTGKYAYHCHILEHEDHEMMRQFQTIACGNRVIEPTETCDDGNTAPGDLCSAGCRLEEYVTLGGVAVGGGSVSIVVEGVTITVPTAAGMTPAMVAAALASAINADPRLIMLRVGASASGGTLTVGGRVTGVTIGDTGLSTALDLQLASGLLRWSSVGGEVGYDLVGGDLGILASSGSFASATGSCVADNTTATQLPYPVAPPPGVGWWFLVRGVGTSGPGSYDSGSASQVGSRDAGIAASGNGCP